MRLSWPFKLLAAFLAAVGLSAVGVYLLASGIPESYSPARLSPAQRRKVAYEQFTSHVLAFGNEAQKNAPYTWSATQEQLNCYLAAADEIAAMRPGHSPGEVYKKMTRARVAEPAVALRRGLLGVMIRSTRYNKILSADLSFRFTDDGRLAVALAAAHVGHLPIPASQVRRLLRQFRASKAADASQDGEGSMGDSFSVPTERVAKLLDVVVAAIDEEPIDTEMLWPVGKKRVRIEAIEIEAGRLTLHVVPVGRKGADD